MEPAGHSLAANCTRVQLVRKWPCSMNSEWGRITEVAPMLAPPGGIFSVARSFGNAPRCVPPKRRKEIFGLKARPAQPVTAKEEVGLALLPSVEARFATVSFRAHEVGLSEKLGRSSWTLIVL